jgi:hypothetical protein
MTMNDGDQHRPDEQRHAVERHARRAQLEDRCDELDRDDSAETSVKVISCAQTSARLPGENSGPASGT